MGQDRESGARAAKYGLETARKIARKLDGKKVGKDGSNEYEINGKRIVIKCARVKTTKVGVLYHMLDRLSSILGAFEGEDGSYDLYEMEPDMYRRYMTPTRSTGDSAGRVGMVRRSIFVEKATFFRNLKIN